MHPQNSSPRGYQRRSVDLGVPHDPSSTTKHSPQLSSTLTPPSLVPVNETQHRGSSSSKHSRTQSTRLRNHVRLYYPRSSVVQAGQMMTHGSQTVHVGRCNRPKVDDDSRGEAGGLDGIPSSSNLANVPCPMHRYAPSRERTPDDGPIADVDEGRDKGLDVDVDTNLDYGSGRAWVRLRVRARRIANCDFGIGIISPCFRSSDLAVPYSESLSVSPFYESTKVRVETYPSSTLSNLSPTSTYMTQAYDFLHAAG